eukprot:PhM_4_TR17329/c0_g2_i1/m.14477
MLILDSLSKRLAIVTLIAVVMSLDMWSGAGVVGRRLKRSPVILPAATEANDGADEVFPRALDVEKCINVFKNGSSSGNSSSPSWSQMDNIFCVSVIRTHLFGQIGGSKTSKNNINNNINSSAADATKTLCSGVAAKQANWLRIRTMPNTMKTAWVRIDDTPSKCTRPLLTTWFDSLTTTPPNSTCLSHRSVLFIGNSHLRDLAREFSEFVKIVDTKDTTKQRRRDPNVETSRVLMSVEDAYLEHLELQKGLRNPENNYSAGTQYFPNLNTQIHFSNARLEFNLALSISAFPQQHDHIFVNHGMWNLLFLDLPTADYLELVMQHFRVIADAFPTTPVTVMNLHYIRVPQHTRQSRGRVSVINPVTRVLVAQQCATLERQEVFRAVIECAAARVFKTRRRRRVSMMDFWEMTKDSQTVLSLKDDGQHFRKHHFALRDMVRYVFSEMCAVDNAFPSQLTTEPSESSCQRVRDVYNPICRCNFTSDWRSVKEVDCGFRNEYIAKKYHNRPVAVDGESKMTNQDYIARALKNEKDRLEPPPPPPSPSPEIEMDINNNVNISKSLGLDRNSSQDRNS